MKRKPIYNVSLKKLDWRGKNIPAALQLRRNLSQTGWENPQTPASPYMAAPQPGPTTTHWVGDHCNYPLVGGPKQP